MRLYSFVNYYLSPLQHGLQTAHCVSEMAMVEGLRAMYEDWAENHKTIIICNGGNVAMLEDLYTRLIDHAEREGLPLVKFYEDEQSLNGALTTVALLVPEHLYNVTFKRSEFSNGPNTYVYEVDGVVKENYIEGSPVYDLINIIKTARLA